MKLITMVCTVCAVLNSTALFGQAALAKGLNEAGLRSLIDKPTVITSSVQEKPKTADGKVYFETSSDAHVVSSQPIEKIYAVLNDFANYPKYFSGSKKVEVLSSSNEGKLVKATAGAALITIIYVYQQTEPLNSAAEHHIVRQGINKDSDERMQNMHTEYYVKTVTIDGKPYTYLRILDKVDYLSGVVGNYMKNNNEKSQKSGLQDIIKAASKK
ncbi:MAG: hypothetical protein LBD22_04530 [Spirochaetaceae bacterium]|nr:hypothetical protein [Spirochaetaceae bacterium]